MKKIILLGNGGHAASCKEIILRDKVFKAIQIKEDIEDILKKKKFFKNNFHLAIGGVKFQNKRSKLFRSFEKKGFKFPKIISKNAYVSKNSKIGNGTIIMNNCLINTRSKIGKNVIVNNFSLIEHDCILEDNVNIATGVIINGNVKIGSGTFVGSGTIIKNNISIGKNCVIQAGTIILKNIKDNQKIL